jgi:hypothetical protein
MDELKQIRAKSSRFALVLTLEIGYCALIYFAFTSFISSIAFFLIYCLLIFTAPLIYNLIWYLSAKKKADAMGMHYALIAQILVLIFVFQFLFG